MKTGSSSAHVHQITVDKPKLPAWAIVSGIALLLIAGGSGLILFSAALRSFWGAQ